MATVRRKSIEQEVKGAWQRVKGAAQEAVGRATGDSTMRAKGELNQAADKVRSKAGEAGRKMGRGR